MQLINSYTYMIDEQTYKSEEKNIGHPIRQNAVVERALQLFVESVKKIGKDTYACKESQKILKQDN